MILAQSVAQDASDHLRYLSFMGIALLVIAGYSLSKLSQIAKDLRRMADMQHDELERQKQVRISNLRNSGN